MALCSLYVLEIDHTVWVKTALKLQEDRYDPAISLELLFKHDSLD